MKKGIAILILIGLAFQVMAQFGAFLYFEVNRDYIAKNECENIAKPQMHCDGQCVLSKLLKKTDQEKENKKAFNTRVLDALVHADLAFEFENVYFKMEVPNFFFKNPHIQETPTSIFHPPPANS